MNYDNDIALLRLSQDVDLGYDDANVLCLPLWEPTSYNRTSCTVAGWGDTGQ